MRQFACALNEPSQLDRRRAMIRRLRAAAQEVRELPDGYALGFAPLEGLVRQLVEFIELERACCPFLSLALEFEAARGPVWLRLRGPEGVKDFMRAEAELAGN